MNRRKFIISSLLLLYEPFYANEKVTPVMVINSVINHMLPGVDLEGYFNTVIFDEFFDKRDLNILIKGAKSLYMLEKNFINLNKGFKERVLREFEKSEEGEYWLSLLLYYGFEAMLGDPIYGGNRFEMGWKKLHHHPGIPRPVKKYGK